MVQVHVTPQITLLPAITHLRRSGWRVRRGTTGRDGFAKLPYTCGRPELIPAAGTPSHQVGGSLAVKKLLVLAALGLGAFAVWRKVQSDRAELDLWTEATAADED